MPEGVLVPPRWLKVIRDASTHLPRTLLVAVAMAVALAGAGAILVSWALVRRATDEGYRSSNPAMATLRTLSIDDATLRMVRGIPGVRDAQARRVLSTPMRVQGTWRSAIVFAVDDLAAVRIGTLEGAGGRWPPPDGTIAIEHSSVAFAGTGAGDTVLVITPDSSERVVPIAGIVRDVGLAPGWMEHVVYAWASTRTLASLGFPSTRDELQLVVREPDPSRATVRQIAGRVRNALEAGGRRVVEVVVPEPGEHIHAAQMDSMLMTQGAFGVLALVVGAFLVVNLLTAMLTGQVREIGVMKTLGATESDLRAIYLAYAAGLGALATGLALPAAVILGRRYAAMRGEMLNFDVAAFGIPWWSVAVIILAGSTLPVLAAWFPVRRATRMTVSDALRDVGLAHDGAPAGDPLLARRGGWSRVLVLSMRNAARKRQRMWLTMVTLASGGAVFVAAGNLRRAVVGSLDVIYGSQRYDFTVRLATPHDPAEVERIVRAIPGVDAAEAWSAARAAPIIDGLPGETFPVGGIPEESALLDRALAAGAWPARGTEPALVTSRSMERLVAGLRPGARLLLDVGGERREWLVSGIFDGGPAPQAYTTTAVLDVVRGDPRRSMVVVATSMDGLASQVDLIQRVRAALLTAGIPVASTALLEESRRVTEDHLLMVVQFLALMGWVMILIGGMGLASTMGLAVLERTREIGVMRAIGARHGAVVTLVQVEGLVIALLGWAVAIPISLPFSLILGEAFGRIMFRVPVHWAPHGPSVLTWLGIAVAVSLTACGWPAWRATRLTIARALAYE